jgi:hypothetical protein
MLVDQEVAMPPSWSAASASGRSSSSTSWLTRRQGEKIEPGPSVAAR